MRLRCVLCHVKKSKCQVCITEDLERLAQVKKPKGLSVMTYADFRRTGNSLAASHESAEDREALETPVCDGCRDDCDMRCTDLTETDDGDFVCSKCLDKFEKLRGSIEGIIRGEGWSSLADLESEINDCLYDIKELHRQVGGLCVTQEVRGFNYEGNAHNMEERILSYQNLVLEGTGNE